MIHPERDQDLLLFAHGQANVVQRARTEMHLRSCAGCRSRLAQLQTASNVIAYTTRGTQLPQWRPTPAHLLAHATHQTWMILSAAVVVIALTATILIALATSRVNDTGLGGAAQPVRNCQPGLPSDVCR